MGFYIINDGREGNYIYERASGLKQHINLSERAWIVIEEDMDNFIVSNQAKSLSGFLNTIFINFHQEATATISQRYNNKFDELEILFASEEFKNVDKSTSSLYISKILNVYESELIKNAKSYPKGIGKKFRINKESLEILRYSQDDIFYEDNIGLYLKAIFEEYTLKPTPEREAIYYKDFIDKINLAIAQENKIKISILEKITVKEYRPYQRRFYVSPYKIVQDQNMGFNYLIGKSEEILKNGETLPPRISSYRISRIDKTDVMTSMSAFFSKKERSEIEETLFKKGPQFIVGDLLNVKISLSKKGIEAYNRQIYMRPKYYLKEKNIYYFQCTEVQIMNYFFKFGRDAQIIEPVYLQNKFISRYDTALKAYLDLNHD